MGAHSNNCMLKENFNSCQCPICSAEFEKFEPYGDTNRQDARCPECGSTERYRLLYLYLLRETNFFEKESVNVLEIGPSKCTERFIQINQKNHYVSVDRFSHNKPKIISDATTLPFLNDSFDLLICYHVFEHLRNDQKAMEETFRVLSPEGIALVQVPIDIQRETTFESSEVSPERYEEVFGQKDHLRIYGLDFINRLRSAGFVVSRLAYVNHFTKEERQRFGLKDQYPLKLYQTCEDLYVCTKS